MARILDNREKALVKLFESINQCANQGIAELQDDDTEGCTVLEKILQIQNLSSKAEGAYESEGDDDDEVEGPNASPSHWDIADLQEGQRDLNDEDRGY